MSALPVSLVVIEDTKKGDAVFPFGHLFDGNEVYDGQNIYYDIYGETFTQRECERFFRIVPSTYSIAVQDNLMEYAKCGEYTAESAKRFMPEGVDKQLLYIKDCMGYFVFFDLAYNGMLVGDTHDAFIEAAEEAGRKNYQSTGEAK